MMTYKTTEEKAIEWEITPRHVQHLCKHGKIEGAVKRAGAWFIPDDAPIPTKNTKSGAVGLRFVGTKGKIFDSAIELFMTKGYGNVSLKDIASQVGIRQSTIYNHFKSKQEILDVIYEYYQHYFLKGRKPLEEMEYVLLNAEVTEVIDAIRYIFEDEYRQKLSDITKIIFQMMSVDERARELGKTLLLDEGVNYMEEVLNRGVKLGRFAPVDTHTLSLLVNSARLLAMLYWIVDSSPDAISELASNEHKMLKLAVANLTDLGRPAVRKQ